MHRTASPRWGKIARKIFFLTRVLPLLLDGRSQLDLIRIIRPRYATRLQESGNDHNEKQYGPHVRDHAMRQPATSIINPPRSRRCWLQMRSGILHKGTIQLTSFDPGSPLILAHAAVGLPTTATPAKNHQVQEGHEHKKGATVSICGVEFSRGHWVEALSTTLSHR